MTYTVATDEAGARLDRFVAEHTGLSRATAVRLIEEGQVRVAGRRGRKGTVLALGDQVELAGEPHNDQDVPPVAQPELPLSVLYEDAEVVVFNKPVGLPSHPLRAGERGTAVGALVARYPECATASEHPREGGLCHRLDVFTSGALLAARSRPAWQALRTAFQQEQVEKEYLALVLGNPPGDSGTINAPLRPEPGRSQRVRVATGDDAYAADVLEAETHFTVERRSVASDPDAPSYSLLRVRMKTGRRHQIRAHLSHIGLPLFGDTLYGGPALPEALALALSPADYEDAQGQQLHADLLRFPSPSDGRLIEVRAPLPRGRQQLLSLLLP